MGSFHIVGILYASSGNCHVLPLPIGEDKLGVNPALVLRVFSLIILTTFMVEVSCYERMTIRE